MKKHSVIEPIFARSDAGWRQGSDGNEIAGFRWGRFETLTEQVVGDVNSGEWVIFLSVQARQFESLRTGGLACLASARALSSSLQRACGLTAAR